VALGEQFEQLCFGTSAPKLDVCLGLYLSPDMIYLAEAQMSGGRPKVSHLVRLPLPPAAGKDTKTVGSLNSELLADQERVGAVLAKALGEIRWKSKAVVATFSHHFAILRYFTFPAIDRRFWKTAVPAEAKKYIPLPFASLSYDFQVINQAADKRKQGALFGVTDQKNISNLQTILTKAGLNLLGVELAPCSVERLWDKLEPGPAAAGGSYAQVHFDGGEIRILVSEAGVPVFFREVALSGEASAIDRRKVDLAGCIDFAKKQLGTSAPSAVRVSGQAADIESWRQAFSQDLGQNVVSMDLDKALALKGCPWGGHAAIGAAIRTLSDTPLRIDMSNAGKISDEDRRAAFTILKLSGGLSAVLALIGFFRFGVLYHKKTTLDDLQKRIAVLEAFRGKRASDIESIMSNMNAKLSFFAGVTLRKVPLTNLLAAIAEAIPDAAWVTDINYDNPLSSGGGVKTPRTLVISGNTLGGSRTLEQDLVFQFNERLNNHPTFKEAFVAIEPQMSAPSEEAPADASAASQQNLDPESDAKHTHFKISCSTLKGGKT
jgi:hypothetical protein